MKTLTKKQYIYLEYFSDFLLDSIDARHHHHNDKPKLLETKEAYKDIKENELLVNFDFTLSSSLSIEVHVGAEATVAEIAAIKNILKALTGKILENFDRDNCRNLTIFSIVLHDKRRRFSTAGLQ